MPARHVTHPLTARPSRRRALCGLLALPAACCLPEAAARPANAVVPRPPLAVGGPGRPSLAQALRQARPGDTVEVHADLFGDVAVIEQPGLTLRGAGGRRVLHAEGRDAEGKAIIVVRAPDVTLQDLEFRGARVPSGNGAGIRFETGSLDVRRCGFFDNENGLLAANRPDMRLRIFDCEFGAAPRHDGLLHHLLYVGAIGRFEISGSRFADGYRGHLLKSRARENVVLFNWLHDGAAGEASYELEMPDGGTAVIVGNIIGQSAKTGNPAILCIGAEAKPGARRTAVVLSHNTLVNHAAPNARFVQFWADRLGRDATLRAVNNVFAGPGAPGLDPARDGDGNLHVELAELVDAARGDFRLGAQAALRSRAVPIGHFEGVALSPVLVFTPPSGTRMLAPGALLAGALQDRR